MKCAFVQSLIPGPSIPLCGRCIFKVCLCAGRNAPRIPCKESGRAGCGPQWLSEEHTLKCVLFHYSELFITWLKDDLKLQFYMLMEKYFKIQITSEMKGYRKTAFLWCIFKEFRFKMSDFKHYLFSYTCLMTLYFDKHFSPMFIM